MFLHLKQKTFTEEYYLNEISMSEILRAKAY
jgi:predicted DNA-binding protein YlxM (UPF0122 family)